MIKNSANKGFYKQNDLHITSHFRFDRFSGVKCKICLQFALALPQMAAAKYSAKRGLNLTHHFSK